MPDTCWIVVEDKLTSFKSMCGFFKYHKETKFKSQELDCKLISPFTKEHLSWLTPCKPLKLIIKSQELLYYKYRYILIKSYFFWSSH